MEANGYQDQQYGIDLITKLRTIEEGQRLLKDRVILIGESLVGERTKTFSDIQELKKEVLKLKEDNIRMKEILQRVSEKMNESVRKEELEIVKRQIDMLRS